MGRVIEIAAWRERSRETDEADRLAEAVERLDPLVEEVIGKAIYKSMESEILAIIGALSVGLVDVAEGRARRLCDRLERRGRRRA